MIEITPFFSGWVAAAGQVDVAVGHKTVILLALEDMDQDGLPDWWEMKFFDHRTGALAERDSDGDGQSNLAEFMAKTHPLDSGFQTQQLTPYLRQIEAGDGVARLKVIGFDGATYTIEGSTNLRDWHRIFARLNSGETTAIGPTTTGTAHSRFFRALVE